MEKKNLYNLITTNDLIIRSSLKKFLKKRHARDKKVKIIEELGIWHGKSRIDIAVINGIMHGYEIKSDQDTLQRLPEQINIFNSVFNKITLVVGKKHLYEAIKIVPEWWGIMLAKTNNYNNSVKFYLIRKEEFNKEQDGVSVAKFLWKSEAIRILEKNGKANGFYSKPRKLIYEKVAEVLDQKNLNKEVRETIFFRTNWRPDAPLILNDD